MDDDSETGPVAHRTELGHREPVGPAKRRDEAQSGDREDQGEEARKPAGAEAPRLDRRLQILQQPAQEPVFIAQSPPRRSPYKTMAHDTLNFPRIDSTISP